MMRNTYLPNFDDIPFFYEKKRLETFKKWPFGATSRCNPRAMARAGWFVVENSEADDTVQCMICEKQLDGWEDTDDPWQEHTKRCPKCPFVIVQKNQDDWHVNDFFIFSQEVLVLNVNKAVDLEIAHLDALFAAYERKKLGNTREHISECSTREGNTRKGRQ